MVIAESALKITSAGPVAAANTFPEIVISGIEVEKMIIALVNSARAAVSSA